MKCIITPDKGTYSMRFTPTTPSTLHKGIVLSLLAAAALRAETIKDIKFDGLVHISDAIAKEIVGIRPGSDIDRRAIDESIKKLYAQQYFEDIWVEEKDGVLIYHVKEKPIIAKVKLSGYNNDREKSEEILKKAGLHKGDIYDETKIKNVKNKIAENLEKEGYFDSVIEVENKNLNPGSLQTDIVVNKGENIVITKIHFYGAEHYGYDDFEPFIANKEKQFMGWFFGRNDGKLKADQLQYDSLRIKDFYLKHGYLDVKVSPPYLKTHFDNYTAELSYKIDEGPQYRVDEVDVDVPQDIVSPEKLKERLRLKPGKIFNVEKLRRDIATIRREIANEGYAFAEIIPDIKQNRNDHTASVTYVVRPNKKVYVHNIVISGNSRTADSVIRREIYLSEGEPFSQIDLQDSLNALKRTGYFNDVKIVPKQVKENQMDLDVIVNEASTGSIMGGVSYGSYDGFGINAGLSDRNFMGTGIEVGTDIDYSQKSLKGSIHFFNPRVFDSLYSFGGNIYRKDYEYYDYKEDSTGGSLKVGRKIGRNLHASLTYAYERTSLTDVSESLKDSPYYQEGTTIKSSLIPAVSYDNTDDYYLPRSGLSLRLSSEYAGVGGDVKFIRNTASVKYYFGLEEWLDYDLILRFKLKASIINDRGNLPLNEKLYLGGMGTVRGFKYGTLAPKNDSGALIGAKKMAAGTFEMSIPLVESVGMRLMAFYDYGTTGEDRWGDIHRSSVGCGIEWPKSPLGVPLQIFYAEALDNKPEDRTSKIEFNLGRRF